MEAAGYIAAILIGISLGSMGGGGAILTVPVFVYMMHVDPVLATTYSLFVVGSCSLVGGVRAFMKGCIDFRIILYFGASSLLTVFLVRYYIVPAIPDRLLSVAGTEITKEFLFMTLFAVLMLAVALFIIRPGHNISSPGTKITSRTRGILLQGILVGSVTGLLGAGGGFLIIPALVLFSKLPMKTAVGSSLTIIACNSFLGFFSTLSRYTINWIQLLTFTAIAVLGIFIGMALSDKIPAPALKNGFGWLVLVMGFAIIAREFFLL